MKETLCDRHNIITKKRNWKSSMWKAVEAVKTVVPAMDITEAFIKEYNGRNPATAAVVRP